MKTIAGAILVLAGAVLFGAGAIAEATLTAANRSGYSPWGIMGMVGGAVLGVVGLILLATSLFPKQPQQGSD